VIRVFIVSGFHQITRTKIALFGYIILKKIKRKIQRLSFYKDGTENQTVVWLFQRNINSSRTKDFKTWKLRKVKLIDMSTTNDLSKNKILGQGGNGTVFEGVWCGKPAAIKRIELINISGEDENKNQREEEALQRLDHPNVIKLLHVERDSTFR
jgi:hypothetical protein